MRHVLRTLAREKTFTAFAVLTLALGIGGVTAIFSIVDGVLLRPLAYKEPGRLYAAAESARALAHNQTIPVNASHFRSWQEQCRSCESGALLNPATFNLTGGGEPERIDGVNCTWPLFQVLGIEAQLGRTFLESDDRPGANKFVLISDALWRRRLGADAGAIGKPIWIDGEPHFVVGVLRPDFHLPSGNRLGPLNRFPPHAGIFKPMGFNWPKLWRLGQFNFACLIRLRPGANPVRAEAEMTAAIADAGRDMKAELSAHLVPLKEQVTGGSRAALTLMFSAVAAVLLIVCVNLGNLMLVRANQRWRDAAIRRALGAGAADLFRAVITENLLIALGGGAVGVFLAYAGMRVLVSTAPIDIPRLNEVHLSLNSLLFALGMSVGSGILCGLWPAIRAIYAQPADALRSGSRSATAGRRTHQTREWLVGLEVALSTVLLVAATLLGISFVRVTNVERGYEVEHILTADVAIPRSRYPTDEKRAAFHERALDKIQSLPGVQWAGLVSSLPLKAQVWGDAVSKEGDTLPRAQRPAASYRFVSEHYFETMGIALLRGRFLSPRDRFLRVALVSESAARKVWPGENPIGKVLVNDPRSDRVTVIGVVADVRTESLEKQPPAIVYVPYWDGPIWQGSVWGNATYVLRTVQDPSTMANALRSAMHELDTELPLASVLTMQEVVSESVRSRRFQTILAGVFSGVALLLACLGIYGVISYSVDQRTNEMGLRIALGAEPSQVSILVLQQGIRPVVGGLLTGVVAVMAAGRWIGSILFGIRAGNPAVISAIMAVVLFVAVMACWAPALRASRIDPMAALRNE
jgi:putative ABC transport system permease protein